MDNNELEVGGIIKRFKYRTILSDIYLKCKTGEVTGILGRNGSGKSMLLQIIFGTMAADDKMIRINGTVYSDIYKRGNLVCYLPQNSFLPKNIKIKRLISVFIEDKEVQVNVLKDIRIYKHLNKSISELSGGELRYLEILLIINLPVKFVLLDEPFSGIEPIYIELIKGLIHSHRKEKGFLITDHDYMNIMATSDTLFLINKGVCQKIQAYKELERYNYLPKGTFTDKHVIESDIRPFEIDLQSLKDLDLFDTYHEGELFSLFNHVRTPGGKNKLAGIFKVPSQSIQEIKKRRDAIKFMEEKEVDLCIDRKQITAIEYYLQSEMGLFKNRFGSSFISYMKNYFSPSSDYYTVETGIQHIIQFLKYLDTVIAKLQGKDTTYYLADLSFKIQDLITKKEIRAILDTEELIFPIGKLDHFFRKNQDLRTLLDIIYELDVLESVAGMVSKYNFTYPEFISSEESIIEINGLFHPLVKEAVPNDFSPNRNKNLCLLTGANMSGKSTFLKSFGIAVYLSHLGFPVPAAKMRTTVFNGMITTINLSDNLVQGYSHFYSEVKRIKNMALSIQKNKKMIVILDELFRGTNVKDAADASLMITSALSKIPSCLIVISTHHVEIAEKLAQHKNIIFNHFEYKIENEAPSYTYKIMKGVSNDRAGLLIIKQERILEILNHAAGQDDRSPI